ARILDAPLDRIELEDISFHRRVREYFLNEAKKDQKRYKVIDGIGSKSDIHSQIKDIVLTKLEDGK
ncbi:MAG: hypothetical protein WCX83_04765, partial [Candidatus Cloacimonas sp.]|nr:dTMP kinase [Candidatus Cloacimonadota bacterium]